jgi:hypothetical protein
MNEVYDNVPCDSNCDPTSGTPIPVVPNDEITGIDLALSLGGSIAGRVFDQNTGVGTGACVLVYDASGHQVAMAYPQTEAGDYLAVGLPAGTYFVRVEPWYDYFPELYDDIPCDYSCDPTTGTPITVVLGAMTDGIDFALQPTEIFAEYFNDTVPPANWTYSKGTWTADYSVLTGSHSRKASAVAVPAFGGCSQCTVHSPMQTAGGDRGSVSLLGWYTDKDNNVELMMKEGTDKWVLRQRINRTVVAKRSAPAEILPETWYEVAISFDGHDFVATVNGTPLITMPAASGSFPFGTVGFQVKATTGRFDEIVVE